VAELNYPEKNLGAGGWARFRGPVPPWPQRRTATGDNSRMIYSLQLLPSR